MKEREKKGEKEKEIERERSCVPVGTTDDNRLCKLKVTNGFQARVK